MTATVTEHRATSKSTNERTNGQTRRLVSRLAPIGSIGTKKENKIFRGRRRILCLIGRQSGADSSSHFAFFRPEEQIQIDCSTCQPRTRRSKTFLRLDSNCFSSSAAYVTPRNTAEPTTRVTVERRVQRDFVRKETVTTRSQSNGEINFIRINS